MDKGREADLLSLIRQGEKRAEEELLRNCRQRILMVLRYSLGEDKTVCEDLANEICLALLVNLREGRFAGESSLSTYVYGITKNMIAAHIRGKKHEFAEIPEGYPDAALTQEEEMEKEQSVQTLKFAVGKLKPKYQEVLYLHYYKDLSIAEIGQQLNISPRQVSQRKHYALDKLRCRKCLEV
jgi:RNA polymerase sigma-70 factor (ECF subfamily)